MNARNFFLLFSLCALVPFAAAKLSLSMGWFAGGATNKGQWLAQEVKLIPALGQGDLHWTVAYVSSQACTQQCESALALLQQLHTGLGRKQLGVQSMLIAGDKTNLANLQQQFPALKMMTVATELNSAVTKNSALDLLDNQFVIINQQGIVLLRYPLADAVAAQVAADLRSDLLRLFNYDRSRL
jgi:hypothetical protein